MTAMMAFFLVLWIVNSTNKETRTVIARYFNPIKLEDLARAKKGIGDDKKNETSGRSPEAKGAVAPPARHRRRRPRRPSGRPAPPAPSPATARASQRARGRRGGADGRSGRRAGCDRGEGEQSAPTPAEGFQDPFRPRRRRSRPAEKQAAGGTPAEQEARRLGEEIAALARRGRQGPERARAGDGRGAFDPASPTRRDTACSPSARRGRAPASSGLVAQIAEELKTMPGALVLRGHTDARPFRSPHYDNWRLSSMRAQMAFYMLVRGGLDEARITRVEGYGPRKPLNSADPLAAEMSP